MSNVKGAILDNKYVIGLLATVLVYLFIIRPLLNGNDSQEKTKEQVKKLDELNVNDSDLTLTETQAADIAQKIYGEMDGFNFAGANSQFWLDVMQDVDTKSDALLVSKYFGVRDGYTLYQWLQDEVSLKFLAFRDLIIKKFRF
jgi:hypothetical protein